MAPTPPMGNWLSTEPGSSVDIAENPIGQRDDNRRGGEETHGKGRNQVVVSYTCPEPADHVCCAIS